MGQTSIDSVDWGNTQNLYIEGDIHETFKQLLGWSNKNVEKNIKVI